jgi:hypothetical protein
MMILSKIIVYQTHFDPTITPAICTFSLKRKSRLSPARSYDPDTIFLTAFSTLLW